jgi:hypothetical protein
MEREGERRRRAERNDDLRWGDGREEVPYVAFLGEGARGRVFWSAKKHCVHDVTLWR